ncbi:YkuS family protein [Pontibacillus litoralis]|uniref:UPF0180 protein N784_00185 n=1 Tax=Pontibacillus litoralis JSM 072002 TaxID=1385512 RepID=A0A0A5GCG6_9BACI|nr:YkuS family protein [Pontibacillus litoralis]KGX88805.1 hypothetical protein N784_00185 [Pontibacillus litoralis JSM 072002]
MEKIGVEGTLTDVRQALQEKGYDIVDLRNEEDARGCDCCVISGQDQNVMGMADVVTQGAVISAHGMTADEVCQVVDERNNR